MNVGGVNITSVTASPLRADDDDLLEAMIIGRAQVDFANGGRADGLLVRIAVSGEICAVIWERTTRRFVRVAVTE